MASESSSSAQYDSSKPCSSRSKLPAPTSRLRQPTVSRINITDKENDAPPGKKMKPNEPAVPLPISLTLDEAKPKNPLLKRVAKKKGRRSIGVKQLSANGRRNSARNSSSTFTTKTTVGNKVACNISRPSVRPTIKPSAVLSKPRPTSTSVQKKPAKWDYKGQLEQKSKAFEQQKEELESERAKSNMMGDILRRLEALEGEKIVIQSQNTDLSGNVQEQEAQISRLKNEVAQLKDEKKREVTLLKDEYEREIRTLRLDLEDTRRDLRKVREERDESDLELSSTKQNFQDKSVKLELIESELSILQRQHNSLKSQYEDRCKTIEQQELDRKKLLNEVQELKGNIRVFCRVRPPIKNEQQPDHINYDGQSGRSLNVCNNEKECKFNFDKVFDSQATQAQVYEELDQLVQSSLDGFNICVFAYGQTGSGKTYTMEGPADMTEDKCGVIPRAMREIFNKCDEQKKFNWEYELCVEHVEIYCETLKDLLKTGNGGEKLEIKTVNPSGRSTIWVSNLSSHKVKKYEDIMKLLALSKRRRATAATTENDHSSRSHSVFMLKIKATNGLTGQQSESTLNLIDLAGSERCGDNGATGTRLKEGNKINGSLTYLSKVISALANKDSHVPYRNSKLTHLLMNSLGGNSKTLMIVNINPSPTAASETINTLRFATTVNQCNIGTAQKTVKF